MNVSVFSSSGFLCSLSVLLLMLTDLSWSNPIRSPENHHRASVGRERNDNQLLDAQDFLSQFLSSLNLTEQRPQPQPLSTRKEPPEYMLELYNRFASDRTAVPSANIVRSFKNEDSSPYIVTAGGARIHPLLFNISMPPHEHITVAELHLFTLVRRAQRPYPGLDCKVTIYKVHYGVVWTKEVRRRDKEEEVELKDLEEVMTKHIHARDNSWVSFDLTHVVTHWWKSGCATHRLEVHIAISGSGASQEDTLDGESLIEIDIHRSLEDKHDAVLIIFSDDNNHKHEKQELGQMIAHENDLSENTEQSQQAYWGHVNHNTGHANQDKLDTQSLMQRQSNLIYDTPPRIRRNVKSEPCKRTPLFVDFKEIGWDQWIIQPLGYEAYMCNGVCNQPLTAEVSPTKHAIVQTLLNIKSPKRVSRACCVPTKLEPISLLYHDNGVITFNHKYEGMVVAECGCR
ncbi:bone morphogenetic protein 10 [Aulostomus maculatus]